MKLCIGKRGMALWGLFFLLSSVALAFGSININVEQGTAEIAVQTVQKIVAAFDEIVSQDMQVFLTRKIDLYVCPNEVSYAAVLQRKFKFSKKEAQKYAETSSGMSRDDLAVIAMRLEMTTVDQVKSEAYRVTPHELAHQLQADLSGNYSGRTLRWMREGTADLIGALVASRCGYESLEKWKLDRINILRNAKKYADPQTLGYVSLTEWSKSSTDKLHPYEVADLMVFYLMTIVKQDFYKKMPDYFAQSSNFREDALNFEEIFGIPLDDFYQMVQVWLEQSLSESASIEVIANGQTEIGKTVAAAFHLGQSLLKEKLAVDLHSNQRIVLADGRTAYIAALTNEFGLAKEQAEKAAAGATWRFNSGTTIIETNNLATQQQGYYRTANIMMKKLFSQQASANFVNNLFWLRNGTAEWFGALAVEKAGLASLASYRQSWIETLRNAKTIPTLQQLQTAKSWNDAIASYGEPVVASYAALACSHLLDTNNPQSITLWLYASKRSTDPQKSFLQVFTISNVDFAQRFEEYLATNQIKSN